MWFITTCFQCPRRRISPIVTTVVPPVVPLQRTDHRRGQGKRSNNLPVFIISTPIFMRSVIPFRVRVATTLKSPSLKPLIHWGECWTRVEWGQTTAEDFILLMNSWYRTSKGTSHLWTLLARVYFLIYKNSNRKTLTTTMSIFVFVRMPSINSLKYFHRNFPITQNFT